MQHCVQLQRSGQQPSMPMLGSFCIEKLGLQMKARHALLPRPAGCTAWRLPARRAACWSHCGSACLVSRPPTGPCPVCRAG